MFGFHKFKSPHLSAPKNSPLHAKMTKYSCSKCSPSYEWQSKLAVCHTIIFFHYCLNKKFSVTFWILQVTGYQNENYIFQWLITKELLRHCSNFLQRLLKKNHYWKFNVSWTASCEITLVRLSIHLSVHLSFCHKFSQDGIISFFWYSTWW